jgi:uncharacterized tellurite resistance protein B-like protein
MYKLKGFTGVFISILSVFGVASHAQDHSNNQVFMTANNSTIDGIIFVFVLGVIITPIYIYFGRVKDDAKRKRQALSDFTPSMQNIILSMASAAKSDNEVANSEIEKIKQTIETITNRKMTSREVKRVIDLASNNFRVRDIQGAITGISVEEKRELLIALFGVIAADGKLRKQEREYSRQLCKGLNISQPFFDATWVDYFEQNPKKLRVE